MVYFFIVRLEPQGSRGFEPEPPMAARDGRDATSTWDKGDRFKIKVLHTIDFL